MYRSPYPCLPNFLLYWWSALYAQTVLYLMYLLYLIYLLHGTAVLFSFKKSREVPDLYNCSVNFVTHPDDVKCPYYGFIFLSQILLKWFFLNAQIALSASCLVLRGSTSQIVLQPSWLAEPFSSGAIAQLSALSVLLSSPQDCLTHLCFMFNLNLDHPIYC